MPDRDPLDEPRTTPVPLRRRPEPVRYTMQQDRIARGAADMDMADLIAAIPTNTPIGKLLHDRLAHAARRAAEDFRDPGEEMLSTDDTAEVWEWAVDTLTAVAVTLKLPGGSVS